MRLNSEDDSLHHRLVKRDAGEDGGEDGEAKESIGEKIKHLGEDVKEEFNKDVGIIAEKTHMKPW